MTRDELKPALAECEGYTFGPWERYGLKIWAGVNYVADAAKDAKAEECKANARLIALAPSLASALREAWEEIDRLQHIVDEKPLTFLRGLEDEAIEKLIHQNDELRSAISKAAGDLSFLDAALNENDGVYRP